jgi:hypothetical protein
MITIDDIHYETLSISSRYKAGRIPAMDANIFIDRLTVIYQRYIHEQLKSMGSYRVNSIDNEIVSTMMDMKINISQELDFFISMDVIPTYTL